MSESVSVVYASRSALVEIAFFSDLYGMSDEQVLRELGEAGLDSLPGGGAEIFAERVRRKICHDKCGADRYLDMEAFWDWMGEWGGPLAIILLGLVLIVSHVRKKRRENESGLGMPPRSA